MAHRKIIIFSHRPHLASLMTHVVSYHAVDVIWCSTINNMLSECRHMQPDLVIILSLTHFINGCGLVERIRENVGRRVTIYAIGWHQSERMVLSLLECGVNQYMTFPISMRRLSNKVKSGKIDNA